MPKPTEWERAQGMSKGMGAKKQLPVCHLCGREFGTASLQIHMKACAKKYEREKGKPAPPAPEMLKNMGGDRPISQMEWNQYNEEANAVHETEKERCPDCGRSFADKERLAKHMRSCTGEKKILRAGEKSVRSGTPESTARPSLLKRMSTGSLLTKDREGRQDSAAAQPKPSLLKRMSSGSLLGTSKPAAGNASARGSGADGGAGGGMAVKEHVAGSSGVRDGGGGGKSAAKSVKVRVRLGYGQGLGLGLGCGRGPRAEG